MNRIAVLFVALLLVGCISNEEVYMHNINGLWDKKQIETFHFEIKDHQNPKNIIFVVRNNNDYPYSNLRIFSKLSKKNKVSTPDTLNYILAKPNGEWLGSGFGETKEILFQYKMNYQFPENGEYTIEIQHAMRRDSLRGVEDFGVKIEPVTP